MDPLTTTVDLAAGLTHPAVTGGKTEACLECGLHWTDECHTRSMAVALPLPHADRPGYQEAWRPE